MAIGNYPGEAPHTAPSEACPVISGIEQHPCYPAAMRTLDKTKGAVYHELGGIGQAARDVGVAAAEIAGTHADRRHGIINNAENELRKYSEACLKLSDIATQGCVTCPFRECTDNS